MESSRQALGPAGLPLGPPGPPRLCRARREPSSSPQSHPTFPFPPPPFPCLCSLLSTQKLEVGGSQPQRPLAPLSWALQLPHSAFWSPPRVTVSLGDLPFGGRPLPFGGSPGSGLHPLPRKKGSDSRPGPQGLPRTPVPQRTYCEASWGLFQALALKPIQLYVHVSVCLGVGGPDPSLMWECFP